MFLGPANSGKTSLVKVYRDQKLYSDHASDVLDEFVTSVNIENSYTLLRIFDSNSKYNLPYFRLKPHTNYEVIVLCYAIDNPESLNAIQKEWIHKVKKLSPKADYILVGTKLDLRRDAEGTDRIGNFVTYGAGRNMAFDISASGFIETSAKEHINVKEVFRMVASLIIQRGEMGRKKRAWYRRICG